jgi:hypothetical protein
MKDMLNSTKIKEFILNPDVYLSTVAVSYFDDSLSEDEEILNLVLDRCSSLSENEQSMLLSEATHLKVNAEALGKIIAKLPTASQVLRLMYEEILSNVDISLIRSIALDLQTLLPKTRISLNQKLQLSVYSTEELLKELLNFSSDNETKYASEFDHKYGELIVDELAKRHDLDEKKIIETLTASELDEYSYYECYLLILAGKRKLQTLIPIFINGLGHSDLISENSMYALMRIGTSDIIQLIVNRYPTEVDDFKIYASGVLENIKLIESEQGALKLLKTEKDETIKTLLAGALCRLFSTDAIPEIKKSIEEGYDSSMLNLEEFAYANCVFNGLDIPEMSLWKECFDEEKNFYMEPLELNLPVSSEAKIGRNDPCPCGSGKKYKKCCGTN